MPVAVRLVEILALITIIGILTGFSIFVVAAEGVTFTLLLIVTPVIYIINGLLYICEKIMIGTLTTLLGVTTSVGEF